MFKDNNKGTRITSDGTFYLNSQRLSALTIFVKSSIWRCCGIFYYYVEYISQVFNSISIADFEQVNFLLGMKALYLL